MINFSCPMCGKLFCASAAEAGASAICDECGERIKVPTPPSPPKAPEPLPKEPSEDRSRHFKRPMIVEGRTGQVELLDKSIRITRRGWLSTPKVGDKEILLSALTAIEFKPAGFLGKAGYIRFVYQGGGETKKGFWETVDPVMSAANDENAVLFGKGQQTAFEELKQLIERRRAEMERPRSIPSNSVADELVKLAELRANGILTDEEFQQQKRKLLQ